MPDPAADAFGAGLGAAVSQLGAAAASAGEQIYDSAMVYQEKKDKAYVRDIVNQARAADRKYMAEQYAKEGKEGINVFDESAAYFDEQEDHWMARLPTPAQQELFKQAYYPLVNNHLDGAIAHQQKQIDLYEDSTRQAFIDQTTSDAIQNRWDEDFVDESLMEVQMTTRERFAGRDREVIDDQVAKETGKFHTKIIEAMIEDNPARADEYFKAHLDEIPGEVQTMLKGKLETTTVAQESQMRADNIVASTPAYEKKLEKARKIKDAKVRDATLARIKARETERKYIEAEAKQQHESDMTKQIIHADSLSNALSIAYKEEDGKLQLQLVKLAEDRFGNKKTVTDPAKMLEARMRIDRGEIADMETLWREYKPYADQDDWKKTEDYFRKGGITGGLKDSTVRTMFATMRGKKADEKPEEYQYVWNYVKRNLHPDKAVTDEVVRQLVSDAMVNVTLEGEAKGSGWWWDKDETYGMALEKGRGDIWLPDVSDAEEKAIISEFTAKPWLKSIYPNTREGRRRYMKDFMLTRGALLKAEEAAKRDWELQQQFQGAMP
jgi:hypothetical protein